MKIYTKTGDSGETALFSGGRVSKTHLRVRAYGDVDELNSVLGCVKSFSPAAQLHQQLTRIQNELFALGAVLATPGQSAYVQELSMLHIEMLEKEMDHMDTYLPELKNFILPDGTQAASMLHLARTTCRRAERTCLDLHHETPIQAWIIQYLNRLSDWLFMAARFENHNNKQPESTWSQPESF